MNQRSAVPVTGALGVLLLLGCGVQSQVQRHVEPDQVSADVSRTFPAAPGEVVTAVRQVFEELTLVPRGESRPDSATWLLTAVSESGRSGSWGELVEVWVRPEGDDRSSVRVVTRRRSRVDPVARGDWSVHIYRRMDARLAAVD